MADSARAPGFMAASKLREASAGLLDAEAAGRAFLRAAEAGEVKLVGRWLETRDRRRLMGQTTDHGQRAAHLAAKAGHAEVLRLLHSHGSEMEARDRFGRAPLHLACEWGRRGAAEALLRCGSLASREDKNGRSALHLAACSEDASLCGLLASRQPHLASKGDRHCRTPLFHAVLNVHPKAQAEATACLVGHRADVNARDAYGCVPLHYAVEEGRRASVQLLLRHHADPLAADAMNGRTPLALAPNEAIRGDLRRAAGAAATPAAEAQAALAPAPPPATPMAVSPATSPPGTPAHAGPAATTGVAPTAAAPRHEAAIFGGQSVPGVLGAPFQALQARFVKIMERVQEGGLEQMEHIKRPHLFTASWMIDVSSHQQLLGQALKYVPGPEVCLRVFNILRPPRGFPAARGDERDILGYYSEEAAKSWGGVDPYTVTGSADESGLTHAGRVELLRAIQDQRAQLESKDAVAEELRRKVERLQAELDKGLNPDEATLLRNKLEKATAQMAQRTEELEELRAEAKGSEGQVRVLTENFRQEVKRSAQLVASECDARRRLEAELRRKGEEKSWQIVVEHEREQALHMRLRLQQQLDRAEASCGAASSAETALEAERRRLQEELQQRTAQAAAASRAAQAAAAEKNHGDQETAQLRQALRAQELAAQEVQLTSKALQIQASEAERRGQAAVAEAAFEGSQASGLRVKLEVTEDQMHDLRERLRQADERADNFFQSQFPLVAQVMGVAPPPGGDVPRPITISADSDVVPASTTVATTPRMPPAAPPTTSAASAATPEASPSIPAPADVAAAPSPATVAEPVLGAASPAPPAPPTPATTQAAASTTASGGVEASTPSPGETSMLSPAPEGSTISLEPMPATAAEPPTASSSAPLTAAAGTTEEVKTFVPAMPPSSGHGAPESAATEMAFRPTPATPEPASEAAAPSLLAPPAQVHSGVKVKVISAARLQNADIYCECLLRKANARPRTRFKTKVVSNSLDPVWEHREELLEDWESEDVLEFKIWGKDGLPKRDDLLGIAELRGADVLPSGFDGDLRLQEGSHGSEATLRLQVTVGLPAHLRLAPGAGVTGVGGLGGTTGSAGR